MAVTPNKSDTSVRVRAVNRDQFILRAIDLEQLIAEDHPARALWEFTGRLDLSRFYEPIRSVQGHAGQPSLDPRVLIAMWLYAYSRGVGSAREISRLCEHEPGLQWLCGMEPINYHSLSDFRVDYSEALTELFTQVLGVLSAEGLITLERVMHDGTRIRAAASGNTFRREATLREHLKLAREQVQAMGDPQQAPSNRRRTAAQQRAKREREQRLDSALQQLQIAQGERSRNNRNEVRISETDPDARVMKRGGGGFEPSYNLQLSTDAAAGVIVGLTVTQSGADSPHLVNALRAVADRCGRLPAQVVADAAYATSENIVALHELTEFIAPVQTGTPARLRGQRKRYGIAEAFAADQFKFLPAQNAMRCPAGETLPYYRIQDAPGGLITEYQAKPEVCAGCRHKSQCCPHARVRRIRRLDEEPEITLFRDRMNSPEMLAIYKQRSQIAEFPNAWIKDKLKLRQFHVRGLRKTRLESLWAVITYNVQQWIRLRWRSAFATA